MQHCSSETRMRERQTRAGRALSDPDRSALEIVSASA